MHANHHVRMHYNQNQCAHHDNVMMMCAEVGQSVLGKSRESTDQVRLCILTCILMRHCPMAALANIGMSCKRRLVMWPLELKATRQSLYVDSLRRIPAAHNKS